MKPLKHLRRVFVFFSRFLNRWALPLRLILRRLRPIRESRYAVAVSHATVPLRFINLASRADRFHQTVEEITRMGIPEWSRFEAVGSDNGALGCALSHARLLDGFDGPEPALMVCEDDIEFLVRPEELSDLLKEFLENAALDVLCLAYNLGSQPYLLSERLALTAETQTTACYVAKKHSLDLLKKSFFESARLIEQGKPLGLAAADQHWKKLQRRKLLFAVPRKRAARQRPSLSDIEGREVFYGV